jgi:hypothetical protein
MKRAEILVTAEGHVTKDRAARHGEAENSFATIAAYWTTHLRARGIIAEGQGVDAVDAALMLGLLKVARVANNPAHPDNWIDLAGYAACGGELATEAAPSTAERAVKTATIDPVEAMTQAYFDGA